MTALLRLRAVLASAVVLLTLLAAPRSLSGQSIPVSLGGQTSSLVGVDFDVPIAIDFSARSELLGSYALTVRWDPAVLQLVGGRSGAFGEVIGNDDSLATGVLLATGVNPGGLGGRVIIGVARFRPLVADTTTLRLSVEELYAAGTFADLTSLAVASDRQFCPAFGRWGDLDGDGAANSRDALIALSASIGLDVSQFQAALGDVDGSGTTEARDALIILSHTVGLDVSQFRVFAIAPGSCVVPTATSLVLDPGDVTLAVGQSVVYTAIAADAAGNVAAVTDVFWQSDAPSVAAVGPGGTVAAVAPGVATITVVRGGGASASATVTVSGARTLHWVDALAFNAVNQLGTAALPFSTIQRGVDFAKEGDTVKIRSGRYEESVTIRRGVVVEGDTAGGAAKPFIANNATFSSAFWVEDGRRVEFHNLRLDTIYQPIRIVFADSVRIRNVDFRGGASGWWAVQVDTVTALRIENSRLVGSGRTGSGGGVSVWVGAGLVQVDSTLVSDYDDDGMELYGVDSLVISNTEFRYLDRYGIYVCAECAGNRTTALVMSRSRFSHINYSPVYVDGYRRAIFDHNVIGDDDNDAVDLSSPAAGFGVVSLLGDSITTGFDYWLDVYNYDSLSIDSISVASGYGAQLDGGRHTRIENSTIKSTDYEAIRIDPSPVDSAQVTGVLRNLMVLGPDPGVCDRCYAGLDFGLGTWDVDSITLVNWNDAIDVWDTDATLRNVTVDDAWDAVYWSCGKARVNNLTATNVQYGIYGFGCGLATDSLVVDSSSITATYTGVYVNNASASVRNTILDADDYGIQAYTVSLKTDGNRIGPNHTYGIYYDSNDSTTASVFARDTVACGGTGILYGIWGSDGQISVDGAVVSDCTRGIQLTNSYANLRPATPLEVRASTITVPAGGQYGIYVTGNSRAAARLTGNTVVGPSTSGAIRIDASTNMPRATIDSNVVDGAAGMGIYAQYADTIRVNWNTVSNLVAGSSVAGGAVGILLGWSDNADAIAHVRGNRVTAGTGSGIRLYRYTPDTVTVLVDSNFVQGVDSMGIWQGFYSRALLTRNTIDNVGLDAVFVQRSTVDSTATVINNNNFSGSGRYGVWNTQTGAVDASNNWWNHPAGPSGFYGEGTGVSTGDSVSANVIWDPALGAPVGDAPVPVPPAMFAALVVRGVAADATRVRVAPAMANGVPDVDLQQALRAEADAQRAAREIQRVEQRERRAQRRLEQLEERDALRQRAAERRATLVGKEVRR
jgi:hypothetical protein